MISCSVVVPIHNEGANLKSFVLEFWNNLGSLQESVKEIHLVENGSSDNTMEVCQDLQKILPVVRLHKLSVPSYGAAIKQGILSASAEVVAILECDFMDASFIKSAGRLFDENQADFVVASKRHPEAVDGRPLQRKVLTFLFNAWLKLFFSFSGTDTHGLKMIRTNFAKELCNIAITDGEVFQTEIVLLAYRLHLRVVEVPIEIKEHRVPTVSVRKRLPKVMNIIRDLKVSLARYPLN